MAARSIEGGAKPSRAERTVDDPLVTGAVDNDGGAGLGSARREIMLRATKVSGSLLPCGGDEVDRPNRAESRAVELRGQSQHDGEPAAVVVDAGTGEAGPIPANRQIGPSRKDRIEVGADDDRVGGTRASTTADHIAGAVGVDIGESESGKPVGDPGGTIPFVAGRGRDLRDVDLIPDERRVIGRQPGV